MGEAFLPNGQARVSTGLTRGSG